MDMIGHPPYPNPGPDPSLDAKRATPNPDQFLEAKALKTISRECEYPAASSETEDACVMSLDSEDLDFDLDAFSGTSSRETEEDPMIPTSPPTTGIIPDSAEESAHRDITKAHDHPCRTESHQPAGLDAVEVSPKVRTTAQKPQGEAHGQNTCLVCDKPGQDNAPVHPCNNPRCAVRMHLGCAERLMLRYGTPDQTACPSPQCRRPFSEEAYRRVLRNRRYYPREDSSPCGCELVDHTKGDLGSWAHCVTCDKFKFKCGMYSLYWVATKKRTYQCSSSCQEREYQLGGGDEMIVVEKEPGEAEHAIMDDDGGSDDDDGAGARCHDCGEGHSPVQNLIVFCSGPGCGRAYHQWCHGGRPIWSIADEADDDREKWYCRVCAGNPDGRLVVSLESDNDDPDVPDVDQASAPMDAETILRRCIASLSDKQKLEFLCRIHGRVTPPQQ